MTQLQKIPRQVQLPLPVAVGVVAQGIRIRLGRSLVTLTGVILGIAFLMSILTTQALKRAVANEDALREAASRMYGALVTESGALYGRSLSLVVTSDLDGEEQRLLARLAHEGVRELRLWSHGKSLPSNFSVSTRTRSMSIEREFGEGAAAVLVLGSGPVPAIDWKAVLVPSPQRLVAFSHERTTEPALTPGVTAIQLARPLSAEQVALRAREAKKERFRSRWIIIISLVVTVIGISNAMLMSVTERFRDIGTMKCLGATSHFIRRLFLLEASFTGAVGGAVGVVFGSLFAAISYLFWYGPVLVGRALASEPAALAAAAGVSLLSGVLLSIVAALYPARFAARMLPAVALRTNV